MGEGGDNNERDVKKIQIQLNAISDLSGGPVEKLVEDGDNGPETISAIRRFQSLQLGFEDGLIDPDHKTELRLRRLNGEDVLLGVADSADLKSRGSDVKSGAHVRLVTDVDVTPGGVEFTTLESTASNVFPNGNGIGERRWRFVNTREFKNLQMTKGEMTKGVDLIAASDEDRAYGYTTK